MSAKNKIKGVISKLKPYFKTKLSKNDPTQDKIKEIMGRFQTSDSSRKNGPATYLGQTPDIFKAYETKNPDDLPIPQCVQFEITNFCTTGCRMCFRWTWTNQKEYDASVELTTERQIELFKELADLGVKTFLWTGGEPVSHPEFIRLIKAAHSFGVKVGVLSNGVGITPEIADAMVEHGSWVRISQDDVKTDFAKKNVRRVLEAPAYGKDHGDIFEELDKSISNLNASMKKIKDHNFSIGLAFTIQKNNIKSIPAMVRYAEKNKIKASMKLAHGEGGKYLCTKEDLDWLKSEVLTDDKLLNSPYSNLNYLKDYFLKLLDEKDIIEGMPTRKYYGKNEITCFTTELFSLIDAFGRTYVCCHLYDDNGTFQSDQREKYNIGSVVENSFESVWRSNAYQKIRKELSPIDVCNMHCSNCTRHWVPNTVLTELHREVFVPLKNELGIDKALKEYKKAVSGLSTDTPVWH
ncbi:radical SAM protein [bacterium]|nr:radical SAM protein [bacterium]